MLLGMWCLSWQFGREWFPPAEASNLRFVINQLLQELFEQEEKEATASAIDSSATLLPVNLEWACIETLPKCSYSIENKI